MIDKKIADKLREAAHKILTLQKEEERLSKHHLVGKARNQKMLNVYEGFKHGLRAEAFKEAYNIIIDTVKDTPTMKDKVDTEEEAIDTDLENRCNNSHITRIEAYNKGYENGYQQATDDAL